MKAIGVIPARYDSKRFPAKVLVDICGKTMLQHVWERAKKAKLLDDLIIACDDQRIEDAAKKFGAKVVMTSKDHSSGTERIVEAVNSIDVETIVNIQADEPLIHPIMIDSIVDAFSVDQAVKMVTLRKKINDLKELDCPHVVKVIVDRDNFAIYFSRSPIPHRAFDSQVQDPDYFKHIGIYGYSKDFLFTYKNLPVSNLERIEKLEQLRVLEAGFKIKVIETNVDSIGVDTPEDLEKIKKHLIKE